MVNDGIGNGNFTTLKPFAFWTQHVLPLVYGDEISYMETLGKMRDILNELIKNNNNLPTYIQQMIEEYISSGAIESVIDKILSNFILNVKYPPTGVPKAKGDGTTNDHDSIQGCIDYAAGLGGGLVYLPAGKYLTSSLVLKPGVTLLGFGRYATSLILDGGATTHLITGTVSDAGLLNLTLNAKMSSQINRVDAVELVGNHIDIKNCIVKDCYTSINVQKTGSAINICDVICEVASDACLRIGGTDGGLLVDGLEMTGLSTNLGVAYIVTDSNGDIYRNINIHGTGAIGIDVSGSGNYFDGKIFGVAKDYEDISGDNTFNLFGKTRVENLTGDMVENANAFSQVAVNGIERQGANISDNAVNTHTINAKDIVLNPTNPLTYKTPTNLSTYFDSVTFKDSANNNYNVLVSNDKTSKLGTGTYYDVTDYGAIGDANYLNPADHKWYKDSTFENLATDDTQSIQNVIDILKDGDVILFKKRFRITAPLKLNQTTDNKKGNILFTNDGNFYGGVYNDGVGTSCFLINGGREQIKFDGFYIAGNGTQKFETGSDATTLHGIEYFQARNCDINNVTFIGHGGHGILYTGGCYINIIKRCQFKNCKLNGINIINKESGNDQKNQNTITECDFLWCDESFIKCWAYDLYIINNSFQQGAKNAINITYEELNPTYNGYAYNIVIDRNYFENMPTGFIAIYSKFGATINRVSGVKITNNYGHQITSKLSGGITALITNTTIGSNAHEPMTMGVYYSGNKFLLDVYTNNIYIADFKNTLGSDSIIINDMRGIGIMNEWITGLGFACFKSDNSITLPGYIYAKGAPYTNINGSDNITETIDNIYFPLIVPQNGQLTRLTLSAKTDAVAYAIRFSLMSRTAGSMSNYTEEEYAWNITSLSSGLADSGWMSAIPVVTQNRIKNKEYAIKIKITITTPGTYFNIGDLTQYFSYI